MPSVKRAALTRCDFPHMTQPIQRTPRARPAGFFVSPHRPRSGRRPPRGGVPRGGTPFSPLGVGQGPPRIRAWYFYRSRTRCGFCGRLVRCWRWPWSSYSADLPVVEEKSTSIGNKKSCQAPTAQHPFDVWILTYDYCCGTAPPCYATDAEGLVYFQCENPHMRSKPRVRRASLARRIFCLQSRYSTGPEDVQARLQSADPAGPARVR